MRFQLIQAEWFRCLLGRFAASGVTDVVVSPGSRSTPLVTAAHADPRLRVTGVHDERSAAFFALGRARATRRPTVLVRTSGTAAAHDYAAVIEASEDHVPLVVVSADRPFELQASGAPQTTDQRGLFGRFVRLELELGLADAAGLRGLDRSVARAVQRSLAPVPGPVHVNARARKPLEPTAAATEDERTLRAEVDALLAAPRRHVAAPARFDPAGLGEVAEVAAAAGGRGVLVAGPLAPGLDDGAELRVAADRFLRASGFVLWAEASSQLRVASLSPDDGFEWTSADAPEVAVLLGRYPSSRVLQDHLRRARRLVTVHPFTPADPDGRATHAFEGPVASWLDAATPALEARGARPRDAATPPIEGAPDPWPRVEAALAAAPFSEAHAAREVAASLPDGAALFLANSLPIRLFDRFVRAFEQPVPVYAQRGVNGIDGLVSGAAGLARGRGLPTAAVLGDVAFLHDLGGLAVATTVRVPLPIVVIDNGGGRIFEELPIAKTVDDPDLVALFTTPHRFELAAAATVFGLPSVVARDAPSLRSALRAAWSHPGATLVHVVVPEHGAAALEARLRGGAE